jgi:hypothetical protein
MNHSPSKYSTISRQLPSSSAQKGLSHSLLQWPAGVKSVSSTASKNAEWSQPAIIYLTPVTAFSHKDNTGPQAFRLGDLTLKDCRDRIVEIHNAPADPERV